MGEEENSGERSKETIATLLWYHSMHRHIRQKLKGQLVGQGVNTGAI